MCADNAIPLEGTRSDVVTLSPNGLRLRSAAHVHCVTQNTDRIRPPHDNGYMPLRTGKDPKMNTEKTAKKSRIRLKIAAAALAVGMLGAGAALPVASHAFAPRPVGATTTTTDTYPAPHSARLRPFVTTHSNGSTPSSPQATVVLRLA